MSQSLSLSLTSLHYLSLPFLPSSFLTPGPEYRGQGVARKIVRHALSYIKSLGYPYAYLWVEKDYLVKFYASLGGEIINRVAIFRYSSAPVFRYTLADIDLDGAAELAG